MPSFLQLLFGAGYKQAYAGAPTKPVAHGVGSAVGNSNSSKSVASKAQAGAASGTHLRNQVSDAIVHVTQRKNPVRYHPRLTTGATPHNHEF